MIHNKQFHLFDDEVTLTKAEKPMTRDRLIKRTAAIIADQLTKNGVKEEDYDMFIGRMLSSTFRSGSKPYKRVSELVKEKMSKEVIS